MPEGWTEGDDSCLPEDIEDDEPASELDDE